MATARRILLLITDLQIGGTPTIVRELAVRLNSPPQVVVEVACLGGRGPVVEQLEAAGIHVVPLGAPGSGDFRVIARLARLIRDRGYDTVFSFLMHANAVAAAASVGCPGVRFLQSIQTTQPHPRWHWRVQSLAHHAADRIVVPSESVAWAAEHWSDVPRAKLDVIANAVDAGAVIEEMHGRDDRATGEAQRGTAVSAVLEEQHGRDARATGEAIPIGFIGRLDPIKRIGDLIDAAHLLDSRIAVHLFGEGRERGRIEEQVRRLSLQSRVFLHGAVDRPQEALRKIDLLVLPSAAEGFGLVLIEAMAAGVPVVATNVPGIRDVVIDGRTGLLVSPGSPKELSAAILRVLGDNELRRRLVHEGREDVLRRFTWEVVLPRYRALLEIDPRVR